MRTFKASSLPSLAVNLRLQVALALDAPFELVDLLPPHIKLPPYISKLLGKLCLRFLDAFVKVELDLQESFEPGDQVVMEDAEIGEWLRFSLITLLL